MHNQHLTDWKKELRNAAQAIDDRKLSSTDSRHETADNSQTSGHEKSIADPRAEHFQNSKWEELRQSSVHRLQKRTAHTDAQQSAQHRDQTGFTQDHEQYP